MTFGCFTRKCGNTVTIMWGSLLLIWLSLVTVVLCDVRTASAYCERQECMYKYDVLDVKFATAYGTYNDTLEQTGWGILNISAGHGLLNDSNTDVMFASGFLEAILTQKRIYQYRTNMADYASTIMNKQALKAVQKFLDEQDAYMRQMIKDQSPNSAYWRHAGYILAQYDGLIDGYRTVAPAAQKLSVSDFQLLNGNGDLEDILNAVMPHTIPDWTKLSKAEVLAYTTRRGRCSALVKVLGAYEDIFMAHSTWFVYQSTMRIFKHYDLNVNDRYTSAKRISFSGYPSVISSTDDFYLVSDRFVVLETTNNVFNKTLYQLVTPRSLLAWHRVRLANMMAHTGKEWATLFAEQNSGTYNNQYMIVDLKQIELHKTIHDNALWVVEQIPGHVEAGDTTHILRTGYWPSYNVPFFETIYNMSGYPDFVKQHGTDFSYQLAPRANIFRRDEGKVKDMDSMKRIMRYNDYKEDPYSEGDACNAICCRGDLTNSNPGPFGCYDTKVSNYSMAQQFTADIINGPTLGTGLPPFKWTSAYHQSHVGLPQTYDFGFIQTKPLDSPNH